MALTIGRAARAAGVNVETIRFYERRGLIDQPRRAEGETYRLYPAEAVARIRFIQRAQRLGFSLREIQDLLSLEADAGADCGDVRARAAAKIEAISAKIAELARIRQALEAVVAACPGAGGALRDCSILEAFAADRPHDVGDDGSDS
jgi:MerR family copper efflux transcriptional regulator